MKMIKSPEKNGKISSLGFSN